MAQQIETFRKKQNDKKVQRSYKAMEQARVTKIEESKIKDRCWVLVEAESSDCCMCFASLLIPKSIAESIHIGQTVTTHIEIEDMFHDCVDEYAKSDERKTTV